MGNGSVPRRLAARLAREQGLTPRHSPWPLVGSILWAIWATSRVWLRRLGGQGFPTLGLMQGERVVALPVSLLSGRASGVADHITSLMG